MRKYLQHPFRSIGAALTLAGTAIVFFALVLPSVAFGGSPSGKNRIKYYINSKGNVINEVTGTPANEDKWLGVVGTNFGHLSTVFCWDGGDWVTVDDWSEISSKLIIVDPADACIGTTAPIAATFINGDFIVGERSITIT